MQGKTPQGITDDSTMVCYMANESQCPENRPQCTNCSKAGIRCSLADLEARTIGGGAPKLINSNTADVSSVRPLFDVTDLAMLHQWTLTTSLFSRTNAMQRFWQNGAVKLALENHHLLESIFAFSALHLAQTTSSDASSAHLASAMRYHDRALSTYQAALSSLEPKQYDAIFLSSVLLFMYIFAYLCGDPSQDDNDLFSSFRWLGTARGMTILRRRNISLLQSGPLGKIFGPAWSRMQSLREAPARSSTTADSLDKLSDLWRHDGELSSDRRELYDEGLQDLQTAFARTEHYADRKVHGQSGQGVVSFIERLRWLAELPESFAELLIAHDPVALILLCHSSKLFDDAICSYWWSHSNSRVFERRIRKILPSRFHHWLEIA